MATLAQDKDLLLKWALGLLVTINSGVMLYTTKTTVSIATQDAVKSEQIQNMQSEQAEIKAEFASFKQNQREKDNEQDSKIQQAILVREDRYWEEKKNHLKRED